jgi:predicted DNA-binding ribbon-helix-helix protein
MSSGSLVVRNVVAEAGRTTMRLEPELWNMLGEICEREKLDVGALVRQIEAADHAGSRTSAVRIYIMTYFRAAATEAGHDVGGHGHSRESLLEGLAAA